VSLAILIAPGGAVAQNKTGSDGDQQTLDQLKKAGSNLKKVHPVDFYLYFPTEAKARAAAPSIRKEGCTLVIRLGADDKNWLCLATKKMLPTHSELARLRKRFETICAKYGGEYDGWEAPIIK
jgi:hypothetical protein